MVIKLNLKYNDTSYVIQRGKCLHNISLRGECQEVKKLFREIIVVQFSAPKRRRMRKCQFHSTAIYFHRCTNSDVPSSLFMKIFFFTFEMAFRIALSGARQ